MVWYTLKIILYHPYSLLYNYIFKIFVWLCYLCGWPLGCGAPRRIQPLCNITCVDDAWDVEQPEGYSHCVTLPVWMAPGLWSSQNGTAIVFHYLCEWHLGCGAARMVQPLCYITCLDDPWVVEQPERYCHAQHVSHSQDDQVPAGGQIYEA